MSDDRIALSDSLFEFARCLDDKDWPALETALTDDTRSYGRVGTADTVAQIRACLDVCGPTQHVLGNVRIEVTGDDAALQSSFRAFHMGAGATAGLVYECLGDYDDRWRRVAGAWLLAARTVRIRGEIGDRAVIGLPHDFSAP